ncbi:MAG: DUF2383 domain-containing protein [Desulfovibrionales bacterium]
MEDKKNIIKQLHSLAQLDADAYHAYGQAMDKVEHVAIRDQLGVYRDDHRRHFDELSSQIRSMGGDPPDFSKDFKGYFIEGFTSLRSATGTKGALEAMQTNEKMTNKNYNDASSRSDLPPEIHSMLVSFYQDEQQHLRFVEQALKERAWEVQETV